MTALASLLDCDAYLFDIDGTLMNVRDATHYNAFHNAVREVFGVDSHIDDVPVHGNTDIGILRAVLRRAQVTETEFESRLPRLIDHMCCEVETNAADIRADLCPSVIDLLAALRSRNKLLSVVSGNLERIGWLKLQAAGLRECFSFGCFSDRNEFRAAIFRQGLDQVHQTIGSGAKACFLGDTPADILAAKELGAPVVAIATGIYTVEDLTPHKPDLCVSCCTDLLPLLDPITRSRPSINPESQAR